MKRRRYSAQCRPLYSTYFTTTRKNDMSCKNINSDFTLFIHSCVFPRAARNKKSNCQQYQDSSRTICRNLTWSLEKLKRYRSCYIYLYIYICMYICIYIYISIYNTTYTYMYYHTCNLYHKLFVLISFHGFWYPNKK